MAIDQFVQALRGKKLSVREIEALAHGFFRGPESFRQEMLKGNLCLPLQQIQTAPQDPDGCSEFERMFLHDLEQAQKVMLRVIGKSQDPGLQSRPFLAQCHLLHRRDAQPRAGLHQNLHNSHDRTADKRKAMFLLHQEGMPRREISRRLRLKPQQPCGA